MVYYKKYRTHAVVESHSHNGYGKTIIIRNKYKGLPVTRICEAALRMSIAESIILPETITHIDRMAFYCCSNLKTMIIPEGIKIIDEATFQGCEQLKEIIIPDTAKVISNYAFSECSSLKTVKLPDSGKALIEAFGYSDSLESIDIPNTFFFIDVCCFFNDDKLQHISVRFGSSDDWLGTTIRIFQSIDDCGEA